MASQRHKAHTRIDLVSLIIMGNTEFPPGKAQSWPEQRQHSLHVYKEEQPPILK